LPWSRQCLTITPFNEFAWIGCELRALSDSAVRSLSLVAFGGIAWSLLGLWIVGGSERFYLLVPPVGLALFVRSSAAGWSRLKARAVPACGCVAGLIFLSAAYEASVTWDCSPPLGRGLRAVSLLEILVAGYFLLSVLVLIAGSYWLLRLVYARLHDRLFRAGLDHRAGIGNKSLKYQRRTFASDSGMCRDIVYGGWTGRLRCEGGCRSS
jgi:hypothetical protein